MVDLCKVLLSATTAQISSNPTKSLNHEQCEHTQHGEESCDDGATGHQHSDNTRMKFVQGEIRVSADWFNNG